MTKVVMEYDDSNSISSEEFQCLFTLVWSELMGELREPGVIEGNELEWEEEEYLVKCREVFKRAGVLKSDGTGEKEREKEEESKVGKYSEYFGVTIVSRILRKLTESRVMEWLKEDRELGVVSYFMGWVNKLVRWVSLVELVMESLGLSKENNKTSLCYQPHHNFYDWIAKLLQTQLNSNNTTPAAQLYREFLRLGWYYSSQRVFQLLPTSELNLKSRLLKLFDSQVNPSWECPITNQSKLFFDLLAKLRKFRIPEWLSLDESYVEEFLLETFITSLNKFPTEIEIILVEDWFEYLAKPWLTKFKEGQYEFVTPEQKLLVKNQVYNLTVKVYCEQRLSSLLTNLNNLPLSLPYFKDLMTCLEKLIVKPKLRSPQLQSRLNTQLSTIPTSQLLNFFTKAIYASSYLDSSGVFLEWLITPLQESLPLRKDSCQLIVEMILFNNHHLPLPGYEYSLDQALHLAGFRSTLKLCKPIIVPALSLDQTTLPIVNDDEEELSWQPPPIDAGPIIFASLAHTNITTASLLVILYRDTDAIVKELHQAIANHLISSTDSDEDLLNWFDHKIQRFGFIDDSQRRKLQIMRSDLLRSLATSTRLSQDLTGEGQPRFFRVIEGSKVAWPTLPTNSDPPPTLPSELQRPLDDYATKFHRAHPNLKLRYQPTRSLVRLRVSLPNQTDTKVTVPFPTATVLFPFLTTPTWSLPDLTKELDISSRSLLRHLRFWVRQGALVQFDPVTYSTWDAPPLPSPSRPPKRPFIVDDTSDLSEPPSDPDEPGPPPPPTLTEATLTAMHQKYSPWLNILLTRSQTPLSLPFLHTNLNRYIMPPNSFLKTVPLPQFQTFLNWLVAAQKLRQDPETELYSPI